MSRTFRARALILLPLIAAAGCQNYNFNPVGKCLIQPGAERLTLSSLDKADVLFVVDDSGSMGAEQAKLRDAFTTFIGNLDRTNAARIEAGLRAIDFHIAVTTTSVFWNYPVSAWTCAASCGTAGQVCCRSDGETPAPGPRACPVGNECAGLGDAVQCRSDCSYPNPNNPSGSTLDLFGDKYCCDATTKLAPLVDTIPCSRAGIGCGTLERHYNFQGCGAAGAAVDGQPYPQGAFVSQGAAPRVLHFDKELYGSAAKNVQGFTRDQLIGFFQQNVMVGTCGSGQEQGLNAARLALEKALSGQQRDTYNQAGAPDTVAPTWPHDNSKLVLVFIGDEDDCSSDFDHSGGVVMYQDSARGVSLNPGNDACAHDATTDAPLGHKEWEVSRFVDYFTSLGRPVGAAFIVSMSDTVCGRPPEASEMSCSLASPTTRLPVVEKACTPGICAQPACLSGDTVDVCRQDVGPAYCGGQAAGTRFHAAAELLRAKGADVLEGSICDGRFDIILDRVAEIVKPPSNLTLPTTPAAESVTMLRIIDAAGETVKRCGRPLQGSYATIALAQETGAGWWFTETSQPGTPYTVGGSYPATRNVYINPKGPCIANPGETYSADYLGQLPQGGCQTDADCTTALGGQADSFTCFVGVDASGVCIAPTAERRGTCICGARSTGPNPNCPNG